MKIQIKENINSIDEFNFLYDSVGWGHYDKNITKIALENTLYSVSIYEDNNIIGYGRIIGDKVIFLYIQDIMVKKEYQGNKIGTKIMGLLLDKIDEYRKINSNLRVYLGASEGKELNYGLVI